VKKGTPEDAGICLIAKGRGASIIQVSGKDDFDGKIRTYKPDIAIVVSFGIIISRETLTLPNHGFVNVHYSLLPRYRGSSPVQATILNGDSTSGITFQKMAEGVDEGDILYQKEILIADTDTTETLGRKMAEMSARELPKLTESYIKGQAKPQKQAGNPTYSQIIKKDDGKIDWSESAEKIERMVRAYMPWPGTYTFWNEKMLKILAAEPAKGPSLGKKPGMFLDLGNSQYGIQTGKGILIIKRLQLEGKKPLEISDFLLGNSKVLDSTLG